ncbi:hypothetical protein EN858_01425 [Mesorhizobium sp. M4B.F.Ca.ET.215.01.1.1]|uniref:PepSY domain-containing protein n=2 Tax=unclassified Mesorhizobium TaxID=325217 RepID=UPI000FCB145B|nr:MULTISPECIES: PepSY domain-containing protein [unclassified Mesorhizobium]RUW27767.1 hypothetical protein EOA34_03490 [Mesorhizobium sp. M4B.F.Ca.ET.013.02.1.1]RUW78722.1 hypothetical protein EOA31_00400 [Mesorhizobium sp. M4B.F.Ca.ET.049.02.1.2]RVD31706.1 hypothetical protein EN738_00750 [Mesorhizobium sp. M4B.F.Ca.ET.017.02.2.1]TGQ18470.1 hypothetical protein EN858_01425 [Mesorhizobium sp. M4B.F.Ca.ET.215.01.1.1]TGQ37048.1 hypothetical protein EN857_15850 [Mesorhizobium sp. M4B.F.Ca.ET.21
MMASLKRLAILGLTAFVLVQPVGTHADEDDDGDHDRARDLYEQGEIKGLADILDIVRTQAPGDVVAVKLVRRANKWVYRFQVVGADGRRTIVDVDAGAGVILRDGEGDR